MVIKKIIRYIRNPYRLFDKLHMYSDFKWMSDEDFLKLTWRSQYNKKLDLNNPKSFNEKIQWLKLNDKNPEYVKMVDKYEVKEYLQDRIGIEYVTKCYGVWNSFDDIDIESLPNQFVLKCTHDSVSIVICRNKSDFDWKAAKEIINTAMKKNHYYLSREWIYKEIVPRIIAEEYLDDGINDVPLDYKFFCFNGDIKYFKIDYGRFLDHKANYFDLDGNLLPFQMKGELNDITKELVLPEGFSTMVEIAQKLSENIKFVRIDFYQIKDRVIVGEITFYPGSGLSPILPEEWDFKLGDWLDL